MRSHLHVPIVLKCESVNLLEPSGPVQAYNGIALPLLGSLCSVFLKHKGVLCPHTNSKNSFNRRTFPSKNRHFQVIIHFRENNRAFRYPWKSQYVLLYSQ